MEEPGLNRLIKAGYALARPETFFTVGEKETKAWTIRCGTKAPGAAGKIHSDFEHGFIRAEVIAYEDYVACQGEAKAKEKGLMRVEGQGVRGRGRRLHVFPFQRVNRGSGGEAGMAKKHVCRAAEGRRPFR